MAQGDGVLEGLFAREDQGASTTLAVYASNMSKSYNKHLRSKTVVNRNEPRTNERKMKTCFQARAKKACTNMKARVYDI